MEIDILIAFTAGLVSFFAPCVIPLLPAYIGYATGMSIDQIRKNNGILLKRKIIISGILYILGFSFIFILLGTTAAGIGQILRRHYPMIRTLGGFIILIFGLEFAGILNVSFLKKSRQFKIPLWVNRIGYVRAFLIGVIFAFAWTPCIGVVLGSILALAAVSQTALMGAVLLFFYSLGISIPFVFLSIVILTSSKKVVFISKHANYVARFGGIMLATLGVLLLTDTYKYINSWLLKL